MKTGYSNKQYTDLVDSNDGTSALIISRSLSKCSSIVCSGQNVQALACRWIEIGAFEINMSATKASIPTDDVAMFKLTIKEHFECD